MQIVDSVSALRAQIKAWRQQHEIIAFVPTMGNLHQGHLSLVTKAREHAGKVVTSVFVNPLQFDNNEDLSAYPQTLEDDIKQLISVKCDVVFTPNIDVMYPQGMTEHTTINVPGMDDKLCGLDRPGHFDGVATVVTKLFNMVQADIAIFGEKDYQQLLLIKKLVSDLNLPIEIIGCPTQREQNGLAMSSRNQYLTTSQQKQAAGLYQTLLEIQHQLKNGEQDFNLLQTNAMEQLVKLGFRPDYVGICRASDLEQATMNDKTLRILAAAHLGKARLIDNVVCHLA